MPTKLESEGRVRKKTPIAWVVLEPKGENIQRGVPQLCAGGEEVLQTKQVFVQEGKTEDGDFQFKQVDRTVWVPERMTRLFYPNIPEPIYQPEDLRFFKGSDSAFRVLTRRDVESYPKPKGGK